LNFWGKILNAFFLVTGSGKQAEKQKGFAAKIRKKGKGKKEKAYHSRSSPPHSQRLVPPAAPRHG